MADPWGVSEGYHDVDGRWHPTDPQVAAAIHQAFGADGDGPPEPPGMWFTRDGHADRLWNPADVELEDGTVLHGVHELPPDLPIGLHWLHPADGWPAVRLVRAPQRCPAPPARSWAVAAQVYALRTDRTWGIGDLTAVRELSSRLDAPVLCSPFHGAAPVPPVQPSPYYASSRLFRDVLLLDIDELPDRVFGFAAAHAASRAARALDAGDRIDRDQVLALKLRALNAIWTEARHHPSPAFASWRARTPHLDTFATYCALSELHGTNWHAWPGELRRPDSSAVREAAARLADRVDFHAWCQYELDRQVRSAAAPHGLIGDLAVGFSPDGFDAWLFQDHLAPDLRIGAPGDSFNPAGQDWGLPPFVPWKVRAARYQPFIDTVTAAVTHMAGIRIDHVLGLFRLFCISSEAGGGAYVQLAHDELLDLVMVAAHRAGAYVVGEDLGTVPPIVREALDSRGMLGCRVALFDDDVPALWPPNCLASVTTHDLPTLTGLLSGRDHDLRVQAGTRAADDEPDTEMAQRLVVHGGLERPEVTVEAMVAVYGALAASSCEVVAVTTDDLAAVAEPPNMPGTIDEWPNWRLRLPGTVAELVTSPTAHAIVTAIREGRAGPPAVPPRRPSADSEADPASFQADGEADPGSRH